MATADKGPEERKQERERTLVGRDKASDDTTGFIATQIPSVDDPQAAKALAMLNQQINNVAPPDEEPFEWFHRDLQVETATATADTSTSATVTLDVSALHGYEENAQIYVRLSEVTETIDMTVIETDVTTVTTTGETTITTDALTPDTEYRVQAVIVANHITGTDRDYGNQITITTPA